MDFIQRTKEESPIFQRMISEAETPDAFAAALAYGVKVDAFNEDGIVTFDELEYAGPDLSPNAPRENSMKTVNRGKVSIRAHSDISEGADNR